MHCNASRKTLFKARRYFTPTHIVKTVIRPCLRYVRRLTSKRVFQCISEISNYIKIRSWMYKGLETTGVLKGHWLNSEVLVAWVNRKRGNPQIIRIHLPKLTPVHNKPNVILNLYISLLARLVVYKNITNTPPRNQTSQAPQIQTALTTIEPLNNKV